MKSYIDIDIKYLFINSFYRKNGITVNCSEENITPSFNNDNDNNDYNYYDSMYKSKLDWISSDHYYIQEYQSSQLNISFNYFDDLISIDDNDNDNMNVNNKENGKNNTKGKASSDTESYA